MPVPRVKFVVRPVSAAARVQFRTLVDQQLVGKVIARRNIDWSFEPTTGELVLDLNFTKLAEADAFRTWFVNNIAAVRALVSGVVSGHLCSHDDHEVYSCRDDPRSNYRDVRF